MNWSVIRAELSFRTSRSSGPGGQHVNKAETKVEVLFDVVSSSGLTDEEKTLIFKRQAKRLNNDGMLTLKVQRFPSQIENKEQAIKKLREIISKSLIPEKKRVATKPTKASVENRLAAKKRVSEKKDARKRPKR